MTELDSSPEATSADLDRRTILRGATVGEQWQGEPADRGATQDGPAIEIRGRGLGRGVELGHGVPWVRDGVT